jgi:hypothetical protein
MNRPAHRPAVFAFLVTLMASVVALSVKGQTTTFSTNTTVSTALPGDIVINPSVTVTFSPGASFAGANATLGNYAFLNWNQNGTLASKVFSLGTTAYAGIIVGTGNSLTLDNATSMGGGVWVYSDNTGASITNQGIIHHTVGTGYIYAPTFLNQGSIAAGAGTNLHVGYTLGYSITNASGGTIMADGTNAYLYLHGITNQGSLTAQNGGALVFQGTNTTASLGTVTIGTGGGHAYLNGTLDNASATLSAPIGGIYELYGGTIRNGTIAAGALGFTNSGGALQSVTYSGDLNVGANTYVTFTSGTTFTGPNATFGNSAFVYWNQNATLAGKTLSLGTAAGIIVGTGNTLTLDSTTGVTGGVYLYSDNTGASIVNQGIIHHTTGGGYIYAPTFTNQGSIAVGANSYLYVGYGSWLGTNASGGTITADGANAGVYLTGITNLGTLTAQNGGTLYFRGTYTTASLGTVVIGTGGGHAYLNGTLDNASATLSAPIGGSCELYGGTINNGAIATGALNFTNSGGTLSNVSYIGDLNLGANAYVTFTNGTSFTGANATFANGSVLYWNQNGTLAGKTLTLGTGAAVELNTATTLTLGSGTTVTGYTWISSATTGASIINQGTITHTSGTAYLYAPTFSNQGSITAGANANLYVGNSGYATTNASTGTITADGANANLYLVGIANQGSLTAQNGGTLYFKGNNTTASLGTVTIGTGGGHAYLNGTLDNASATLSAPIGGSYELNGGTINNGTIAAGALSFTPYGGTLSNVSYLGDLNLPASGYATFTNGTSFTGTNAAFGNDAFLYWNQNSTLAGKVLTLGANAIVYLGANNATLTLGGTTTMTGNVSVYSDYTGAAIVNQGTINHTTGNGTLYAPTFTNQGSITAGAGASLGVGAYGYGYTNTNASTGTITADGASANIYLGDITNQGSLTAKNGGALYFKGTNTTASLGTVTIGTGGGHAYFDGTLDNSSATLNAPTGGSFELYSGTISSGIIAPGALSFTSSGGTLSNVSYTGDLILPASAYVTFTNGTSFTGTNATLGNNAYVAWNQNATLAGKTLALGTAAAVVPGPNNTLTLDSATTVTGGVWMYSNNAGASITNQGTINHTTSTGYLYAPVFTNQGSISAGPGAYLYLGYTGYTFANPAGGSLHLTGGTMSLQTALANAGLIDVQSGTFYSNNLLTNGATGTIMGSGTIYGDLSVAGGTISPGNSIGTLTLASGGFTVTNPATFAVELSGATADALVFQNPTSVVNLGSGLLTLSLTLLGAPTSNSTYNLISIASGGYGLTGYFSGLATSGDIISASYLGTPYDFSVQYLTNGVALNYALIPEPSTYALLGAGLTVLAGSWWRRRRRSTQV